MSWLILFLAGVLEVAWAIGLKQSAGFTRLWPSVFTAVAMAGSVVLLGLALRHLPLGTAYAVWTGIGTVGTAIFGMIVLGEPAGALRLASIARLGSDPAAPKRGQTRFSGAPKRGQTRFSDPFFYGFSNKKRV